MPVINLTMGRADEDQKTRLIHELTSTASEVTGIPPISFTVVIHEMGGDNIGWDGKTLSEHTKA